MLSSLNPLPQLPNYRGPHRVGSCEYEIPVSELSSDTITPDKSITTIKFRVYYPTTSTSKSKTSIPWLPTPQKEGNRAYAKFLGLSDRSSGILANLPSMLSYPTIPAVHNAPLPGTSKPYPVVIFSHGLGGNYNTYSSFVGSLASCGMVVVAPEHRDQSAPISFIRSSQKGSGRPVPYRRLSHSPTVDVLNARNKMLRIRLWELERLYSAISSINVGKDFTNLADTTAEPMPAFKGALNLAPGKLTWAGHSFGAATVVQFVKSVYYRQASPPVKAENSDGWDYTPLYTPANNDDLSNQVTPDSPMVLLDLWTMPLTSKSTHWLWEKPLPCYDRKHVSGANTPSNVVSIMSNQFFKWPELLNRTKAILSSDPQTTYINLSRKSNIKSSVEVENADSEEPSPQLSLDPITKLETSKTSGLTKATPPQPEQGNTDEHPQSFSAPPSESSSRTPSPAPSTISSLDNAEHQGARSSNSSASSLPLTTVDRLTGENKTTTSQDPTTTTTTKTTAIAIISSAPQLYLIPTSAHLSQSDFGVLFPNVTKYLLKTIEPSTIMELNVRAATAMLRNNGVEVAHLTDVAVQVRQNLTTAGDAKTTEDPQNTLVTAASAEDQVLVAGAIDEALWRRVDLAG